MFLSFDVYDLFFGVNNIKVVFDLRRNDKTVLIFQEGENQMKKSIALLFLVVVLGLMIMGCTNTQPADEKIDDQGNYTDVSVMEASDLIDSTEDLVIIDVSPAYDKGHLPGAINYPVADGSLADAIPTLDEEAIYLVYCHTDEASMEGAQTLVDAGFENVYRLDGNYSGWVDEGLAVEK